MQRQEKDPIGQMFAFILLHQNDLARERQLVIGSPPRHSSMAAAALGSATENVLRLHGGAGPQQQRDHLDVAVLCRPMQGRLAWASGRRL